MPVIDAYGYPPVGRCIYCRTTERRLTKEHVIARAIGGTVTLAKSSCAPPQGLPSKRRPKTCSEITRDIEQYCFRNMLGHFRHRIGFPSSQRFTELPLTVVHTDRRVEIKSVPVSEHLAMFCVPIWQPPRILTGQLATNTVDQWSYISNPDAVKQFPEGTRVGVIEFNERPYAKMLAKIAHAFACADSGMDSFEPLLPDFILGRDEIDSHYFVGCFVRDLPPEPDALHRVHLETAELGDGRRYLVANMRLFAKFGAPQYHVVVGKLPPIPSADRTGSGSSSVASTEERK